MILSTAKPTWYDGTLVCTEVPGYHVHTCRECWVFVQLDVAEIMARRLDWDLIAVDIYHVTKAPQA